MASFSRAKKAAGRPLSPVDDLISQLREDSRLKVESAVLIADEAEIAIRYGNSNLSVRIIPKCDRPHYSNTRDFTIYYLGSGDLAPEGAAVLDRIGASLREIEKSFDKGTAPWPPNLPRKILKKGSSGDEEGGSRGGKGRIRVEVEPVVVNCWTEAASGRKSLEITLRVWNPCNQRCSFCQVEDKRWNISHDLIVEAVKKYGTGAQPARLNLSGGEPTLNPRLHEYVNAALGLKYTAVVIQTNAVRYSRPGLAASLKPSDRLVFFVSFHGFDSEAYDEATRTKGLFPKALAGINNILEAGHMVMLNTVFTSSNLAGFPSMVKKIPELFPHYPDRLSLQFSAIGSFPAIHERMHLLPKLTDVFEVTRIASREARRLGVAVWDFSSSGFCTLPPCVLTAARRRSIRLVMANLEDLMPEIEVVRGPISRKGTAFIKSPVCRGCRFDRSCPGVIREYGIVYGLGELKAICTPPRTTRKAIKKN